MREKHSFLLQKINFLFDFFLTSGSVQYFLGEEACPAATLKISTLFFWLDLATFYCTADMQMTGSWGTEMHGIIICIVPLH